MDYNINEIQNIENDLSGIEYVMIKVGDEMFGINIAYIDNIVRYQKFTRVPKAQSYFKGVINLRGEIISVMSLRLKLGLPDDKITKNTRIIIVKPEEETQIGIIVDEIKEVIELFDKDVEKNVNSNPDGGDVKVSYVDGVGKYGNLLVSLINIRNLIIDKDMVSV
ncbi:MAG: chemotaxis protein CheW [Lachnospiraceae bacterium]|nr:chemotaxis protein CheW [Lachnospiraceae bacterium]